MSTVAIIVLAIITHFGYAVYCRSILAKQCPLTRVVADYVLVPTTAATTDADDTEKRKWGREIGDPLVSKAVECVVGGPSPPHKIWEAVQQSAGKGEADCSKPECEAFVDVRRSSRRVLLLLRVGSDIP